MSHVPLAIAATFLWLGAVLLVAVLRQERNWLETLAWFCVSSAGWVTLFWLWRWAA